MRRKHHIWTSPMTTGQTPSVEEAWEMWSSLTLNTSTYTSGEIVGSTHCFRGKELALCLSSLVSCVVIDVFRVSGLNNRLTRLVRGGIHGRQVEGVYEYSCGTSPLHFTSTLEGGVEVRMRPYPAAVPLTRAGGVLAAFVETSWQER